MKPTVAILCGGRGTRVREHVPSVPKPLVEVGDRPILWHVVQIFLAQGFTDFKLLTGYRGEQIEVFVTGERWPAGVHLECVDTGEETPTGGRLYRAADRLGRGTVCVTYADGVADIDLDALLAYHRAHRAAATMTVVRPELQFGVAELNGDGVVRRFIEKPRSEHWVNGGFMCLERAAIDTMSPDSVLEREPLERLAAEGRASRLPARGLLEVPRHLQGRGGTRRPVVPGRGAMEAVGLSAEAGLTGQRILVTGAHGLLGSWLVEALLDRGTTVVTIRRDEPALSTLELIGLAGRVDTVRGDIAHEGLVARALAEYEIDGVFHLAAQTLVGTANRSPMSTFETNVRGTWMLLEACRLHGVTRVVVASSDKAYGHHGELPYRETHPLDPRYPYDVSKAAADMLARAYWHTYSLPVAVTRFANLYGGGDLNRSRLIPEAVTAALAGRAPVVRSDGSPERDFLYVEDAARAYLAIWEALGTGKAAGEAFNAGSGRPHRVGDVVELISRLAGTGVAPDIRGKGTPPGEIDRQWVDYTKLHELTGWQPQIALEDGLRRTIDWYRVHPETWQDSQ